MTFNPFSNINSGAPGQNNNTNLFSSPNQNNNQTNLFGANSQNNNQVNTNSLFGIFQNSGGQNNTSIFGNNQNIVGNLNGINNNNNQQQNNILFNQPNGMSVLERDQNEFIQILKNIEKCFNPCKPENMFKDYIYRPIKKGQTQFEQYKPYEIKNNQRIINDYNIWEEGHKNNPNQKELYTSQISSVDQLLERNKELEKAILKNIGKTVDSEKNMEKLNQNIDEEMNNKIMELKNCHLKIEELELKLSSKIAQCNYIVGTAKENVNETKKIKDTIKLVNDTIKDNNMLEICEKVKKTSNENIGGDNKNYFKDINKSRLNDILNGFVEIQNVMNVVERTNKKNLSILQGIQKEFDRITKKNQEFSGI